MWEGSLLDLPIQLDGLLRRLDSEALAQRLHSVPVDLKRPSLLACLIGVLHALPDHRLGGRIDRQDPLTPYPGAIELLHLRVAVGGPCECTKMLALEVLANVDRPVLVLVLLEEISSVQLDGDLVGFDGLCPAAGLLRFDG